MKTVNSGASESDAREIDARAKKALNDEAEFELLLQEFRPFLLARASRLAGRSADLREEMAHVAGMAFYESVKAYSQQKGHFFHFMNSVVHNRLIDSLRKSYAKKVETIPLETAGGDGGTVSSVMDKASVSAFRENERRYWLVLEIECFKSELSEWNITMDDLVSHSPKQARLRAVYGKITAEIADDAEIIGIIFTKHYFPINKISVLTKVPHKTVERGRIYLIASLIIRLGDYDYLKGYIAGGGGEKTGFPKEIRL